MAPRLFHFGQEKSPVVVVDDGPFDCDALIEAAAAMAPFPVQARNYYPGLRRILTEADEAAWTAVTHLLEGTAPFIAGGFDCDGFTLVEASFSLVTTAPAQLEPAQRHPHFDSTDPDFVALIVYLFPTHDCDGTAFYRHDATGIEVVRPDNVDRFIAAAQRESSALTGFFMPGRPGFTPIGELRAHFGTMGIWRGNVLHSGLIPPGSRFSADPREGRLTLNLFLQLRRAP